MADNNTIIFNQVAKTGTFGSVIDAVNSNFDLAKIAILKMKGKSAYEIWREQEGNENKTVTQFLASLKESGFETEAVATRPSAIANINEKTIYAIPDNGGESWSEYIYVGDMSADYDTTKWIKLATHDGSGLSDIISDIDDLKQRDEPIVFTESKEMNAFIKHLFVDLSDYNGSADVSNLYAYFFVDPSGNKYLSVYNAISGNTSLISFYTISNGKGCYCERLSNGIYFYLEVNENLFPSSTIQRRAKLTSWCFSPTCDPRLTNSGITESPIINKYLTALYVDLTNYTGEFDEIKYGLRLYGLCNSVNQTNQYYLGFLDANGNQRQILSTNTKPAAVVEKSFSLTGKGSVRIIAKVNWDALVGNAFGSQSLRLNPCVFEKDYFYAQIDESEAITVDGLKSMFSTRVFTDSAVHNQIIKKLYIDTSGYTGSLDLSAGIKLAILAKNVVGLWGIQLRLPDMADNHTVSTHWMSSERNKQSSTNTGVYLYAEYDWNAFPDESKSYGSANLTKECFNPINDPRKSVGLSNLTDELVTLITEQSQSGGATTPLTGGVYGCIGDSITQGAGIQTSLSENDNYAPLSGSAKPTYGYYIAKTNRMSWHNYGVSGSTLADVTANGVSRNGFAKANGRYTQLAANLTHISIFFGWNDNAYGHVMKREDWLLQTYGTKIYYPMESSLIGTTHTDGTPYTTREQYDACNAVTGSVNGVAYNNSSEYWKALYIGSPSDTTPDTFWGAWNIVLKYIIDNYPLAKILLIVPYLSSSNNSANLLQETVRLVAHKYGLLTYDFNKKEGQLFAYGWYAENTPNGYIGNLTIRQFRDKNENSYPNNDVLMKDGAHPNENGYKYMYPSINAKLCSI